MDLPVVPKLPDGCGPQESEDDCAKRAWKFSLGTTCKLVASGFGAPEASPLCDALSGPAALITYPILRYVLGPAGSAMQSAIVALLPSSLTAQGTFSPNVDAMIYWQGPGLSYPILTLWKDSIKAVEAAWDQARKSAGLPPAPLRLRPEALTPDAKPARSNGPSSAGKTISSEVLSGLVDQVSDGKAGGFVNGAESCLYWVLYRMTGGWGEQRAAWGSVDGDNVNVITTHLVGKVQDVPQVPAGGDPDVWIGYGPFGVKTNGWSKRTTDYARRLFHDMLVANLWQFRIDALNRAVPYVISVAIEQVAAEQLASQGLSRGSDLDISRPRARPGPAAIATATVATAGVATGAGYLLIKLLSLALRR